MPIAKAGEACAGCGNFCTCTCDLAKKHKARCRFRRAASLSVELACEHGYQACVKCDPCDCGAGQKESIR